MAHYGAKVLHPRALIPIAGSRIVLHVRSFLEPEAPGTEVSARRSMVKYPVKALAIVRGQAIVTVAGKGMVGVHGIAARTFGAIESERLSVSTIFQASSESSIGFTLAESEAPRAVSSLRQAFRDELASGLIDNVTARPGMAVIAVVGDGMAGSPGIAARVFSALAGGGINVVAIAQGSSERNISFAVTADQAAEAARRVHTAFQLSKIGGGRPPSAPRTDVVFLGFGRVGRALADQIAAPSNGQAAVRVVGLLDRSGYVFEPRGLSNRRLLQLTREKDAGAFLSALGGRAASASEALTLMAGHAVSRPVIVDVTSDETDDLLRAAVGHGFNLVLANKKPLAGSWASYERLLGSVERAGRLMRYEATVGAGLPIIDTFHKLVETGDRVLRIEGSVSGTLMYVMSAVSAGKPFSQAVREAVNLGYAEPDPRDDLTGRDAARKALILARLLGYRGPAPVPQDLVPRSLKKVPAGEFLDRLAAFDDEWAARVSAETARGRVLRYLVTATQRTVSARLSAVADVEPGRLARRNPQPGCVHDSPIPHRAAGHQRTGRRRRGHGGGHPERHLLALGTLVTEHERTVEAPMVEALTSPGTMLRLILNSRVYDVAHETPLEPALRLSRRLRNDILLKREDLQPIFSYKLRGAYNRVAHLSEPERARGVIAASAGNHAQGVAFAARHLGLRALIVMPQTTPEIKVDAVREMGAEVVLHGDSYADAQRPLRRAGRLHRDDVRPPVRRSARHRRARARSARRSCGTRSATWRRSSFRSAAAD